MGEEGGGVTLPPLPSSKRTPKEPTQIRVTRHQYLIVLFRKEEQQNFAHN